MTSAFNRFQTSQSHHVRHFCIAIRSFSSSCSCSHRSLDSTSSTSITADSILHGQVISTKKQPAFVEFSRTMIENKIRMAQHTKPALITPATQRSSGPGLSHWPCVPVNIFVRIIIRTIMTVMIVICFIVGNHD